ncbi:tetratricopeptide repeat protein [Cyanobium sp. CH-040]|uniref:tetratricopeptide repeat protein n=1 Tax=Cyanobium sp. CH-040 TaxID=2823708 RepID=UPI0020CFD13A|nr:tetratricopeptide repeat protein [Cyanobium sp. CH-040]MCP9926641.1 tetratricopeptide repeat protein [Cyanobium sp. CH-040]
MTSDSLGNRFSGADDTTLQRYGEALEQFHCFRGDPLLTLEPLLAERPGFAMGHLLHAWLHLLSTEPEAPAVARDDLARVGGLPLEPRERGHAEAIEAFAAGHWRQAGRILDELTTEHPRDALALQAGHLVDLYRGDAAGLRSRPERALPHWQPGDPGYHALLGMLAFGCEENGDYRLTETHGRQALELEPRNAWAHHAVAHVFAMENRPGEGITWMRQRQPYWADDNALAIHNWWHLALFHLELDEIDAALDLFDGPIHGQRSAVTVDLVDASSLLWRLQLRGVDAGERWRSVADLWRQVAVPGLYVFNDLHAAMAWIGSGDRERSARWIAAQSGQDPAVCGDGAAIAAELGAPLLRGFDAWGRGDAAEAAGALGPVLHRARAIGGSHAQRQVIALTLEAAQQAARTAPAFQH